MAKQVNQDLWEGIEVVALAAKTFLNAYDKAKKELEGTYPPMQKKDPMDRIIAKRRLAITRSILKAQNKVQ